MRLRVPSVRLASRLLLTGGAVVLLAACDEETETTWEQYNGDADQVQVEVGAETRYVDAGDPAGDCSAGLTIADDTAAEGPRAAPADTGDTGGTDTGDTGGTDTGDTGGTDTGAAEQVPEVAAVVLTSNTGAVEIGWGCVSPSAGPPGTVHTVQVRVLPDYKDDVGRASVRTESGDAVGDDEYDLEKDSTGEGYWVLQLQSVDRGESRTDTLTFRLWKEIEATEDAAAE